MEFKELKIKTEKELYSLLASSREKIRDLKFKIASGQLKNVREVRETKKTIAQILTLLRQRKK
ncbi:MAG: 50S ribosomal protein L29 [Parcubacteria group bacterium CG23_combo_of_CG06-09_8_20_14_all_35_9]|nr:MAG: 50S ribosomal protein L29 [Parcubacteria group bacterium CG23_combo_of_CG06-09_8_20_14_all_35_9]